MSDAGAQAVRLLCLDVDGVLTDGGISIDDAAIETKRFHVRDGTGLRAWMAVGHEVAIITGRRGMALQHRASELGIRHVLQGVADKQAAFGEVLHDLALSGAQAAAIGDDLPDLPLLRLAGYPIAVADAVAEVKRAAVFVTVRPGGQGAVREAIEHLLKAQTRWDQALETFT
jgi:3-deoxy-D-manno-octulosonate 8-phosphate phosphatase (KDO 8-P phosphatase)